MRYREILFQFGFDYRIGGPVEIDDKCYFLYSEKDRYTNVNKSSYNISVHTNYKSYQKNRRVVYDWFYPDNYPGLKLSRGFDNHIFIASYKCNTLDELLTYLSKMFPQKARELKLKRILNV